MSNDVLDENHRNVSDREALFNELFIVQISIDSKHDSALSLLAPSSLKLFSALAPKFITILRLFVFVFCCLRVCLSFRNSTRDRSVFFFGQSRFVSFSFHNFAFYILRRARGDRETFFLLLCDY